MGTPACYREFVELARVFERSTAVETEVVPQVVNNVIGTGFHQRSHHAGMLSLALRSPILVSLRPRNGVGLGPKPLLPPLQLDRQFGNLNLQLDDPSLPQSQCHLRPRQYGLQGRHSRQQQLELVTKILHDPQTLAAIPFRGKIRLLNSYGFRLGGKSMIRIGCFKR